MANIRLIGRRIKGVKSTAKITKAMEMIAASKMRRAQERGVAGRPYSEKITQVLSALAAIPEEGKELHPCLICRKPVSRITTPAVITPTEDMVSPNICQKAAFTFRLRWLALLSNINPPRLAHRPIVAITSINGVLTGDGSRNRW